MNFENPKDHFVAFIVAEGAFSKFITEEAKFIISPVKFH